MSRSIFDPNIIKACSGISSDTVRWSFSNAVGTQLKQFARMGFDGEVTSQTSTNVATSTIYKNNSVVTAPFTFVKGDRIFIEITKTSNLLDAYVSWKVKGIAYPVDHNALTTYKPRTSLFTENIVQTDEYVDGFGIQGQGNTTSFLTNIIFANSVNGEFNVFYEPAHYNFTGQLTFGLNDQSGTNTPANRYPRMRYCIMLNANAVQIYELGVLKTTVTLPYNQMFHYKIYSKPISPGVYNIAYYYSTDNMVSWILMYTSLNIYNGTTALYADWATQGGYYAKFHTPKLQQL